MKENLRKKYIAKRKEVTLLRRKQAREAVFKKLCDLTKGYKKVLSYVPLEMEVCVNEFNEFLQKEDRLYLPKIVDQSLAACRVTYMEKQLITSAHAFLEPDFSCEKEEHMDVVIVPGVIFDHYGGRVGFGKGYYDRFLENRNCFTIGVCFKEQVYDGKLILQDHDIPMEHVCIV